MANTVMLLFGLIAVLFLVGYAAIALLMARKKSWIMMTVRVGITVLAAILAIPIALAISGALADLAYDSLLPTLGLSNEIQEVLQDIPVGSEGLRVLASLAVSPILYVLVFLLLRLICLIVVWIVEKCVTDLESHTNIAITLPLGAVNGLLTAIIVLIPLCGYCAMGAHMINTMVDTKTCETKFVQENILDEFDMTEADLVAVADTLENNAMVSVVHNTLGKPVFKALTTAKLDKSATHGEVVKINLEKELCGLVRTMSYALEVADSFEKEDYTEKDKELLYETADRFLESDWIRMLATDMLVTMSTDWLANKDFAGYDFPRVDPVLQPTMNCILTIVSKETVDTLEEDIHVILDVVGDFLVYDLMTMNADYTEILKKLGSDGLLTNMLAKLQTNERLAVLGTELKSLSVRLVTNMLGVEQLKDGQYAEMMGTVAGKLTDSLEMSKEDRDALVVESVQDAFADEGYDVPPDVVIEVTDKIVADLGGDGEISSDELTDYLINHSDELAESLPDGLPEDLPDEIPDDIFDKLPQD